MDGASAGWPPTVSIPGVYLRTQGLHGVFVGAHAISEGALSRAQLKNGPYVRVLHGVYADPSQPRDHMLTTRAAALLMPPGAVLGGRTAAALHGAPSPSFGDPVTVVVPPGTKWRGPQGVRVHTAELPPADVVVDDDLAFTAAIRTAWDVAVYESVSTAVGVLDDLVRRGQVTHVDLLGLIRDRGGAWGSRRVRRAFALVDGRAESPPESWVRVACALGGLPAPVPQYEVVDDDGGWLARVDLAWPEQRVIVEYEGAYHFDGLQLVRDDERYRRLLAAGWQVIRVAAHDLRDMAGVVALIRAALAARVEG